MFQYQQKNFDLSYTKLNWILVANSLLITQLITQENNSVARFCLFISCAIALLGIRGNRLKMTEKINDQLASVENKDFLNKLIKKKREAYIANEQRHANINNFVYLSASITLFVIFTLLFPNVLHVFIT